MTSKRLTARVKTALIKPARFYNSQFAYVGRMEMAFARGALNVATRHVDDARAASWEFSAFSQNGEDGIIDHLLSLLTEPNRYFVEVGAADGLENNSSYLAFAKKYNGLMVEGSADRSRRASEFLQPFNWSVRYLNMFVEPATADVLVSEAMYRDPDFFSLDIDGNDYFVMEALLRAGLRPKVVCVEYNSTFGPLAARSIVYTPQLDYLAHHPSQLYYGISVTGWRRLFSRYGYTFVTVDTRGVNAFFVRSEVVVLPPDLQSLAFAENATQLLRTGAGWESQWAQIQREPFIEVS